ncbi:MAG: V-type ATPase subunit [Hadesarchaea archaeon]|nr:V-type ATPase subunit [Hadesarchaea archaeon]
MSEVTQYILLVAFLAVALSVAMSFIFRWIRTIGTYAYAGARIGAMKGELFRGERLNHLIRSEGVDSVMSVLQSSPYSKQLSRVEKATPPEFEMAFRSHQVEVQAEISAMVPDDMREVLDEMSKIVDVQNLKTLLICKEANVRTEEAMSMVSPGGRMGAMLERIYSASNVPELVGRLEGTEYWPALSGALDEFERRKSLLPLLHALDRHYYERLWRKILATRAKYIEVVKNFIGLRADVQNIKLILRCKRDNLPPEDILRYVLPIRLDLSQERIRKMAEARDVVEAILMLEGTDYGKVLSDAIPSYAETKSTYVFEKALDDFVLKRSRSIAVKYYVGIGPVIGFLMEKEAEVRNLTAVVNGKAEGEGAEEIEKYILRG